jgi:hypothetical protein
VQNKKKNWKNAETARGEVSAQGYLWGWVLIDLHCYLPKTFQKDHLIPPLLMRGYLKSPYIIPSLQRKMRTLKNSPNKHLCRHKNRKVLKIRKRSQTNYTKMLFSDRPRKKRGRVIPKNQERAQYHLPTLFLKPLKNLMSSMLEGFLNKSRRHLRISSASR